jgi:hypothetical protein
MRRIRENEELLPWVVEKFVRFPPPGHRVDLYGFIDILVVGELGRTLGIQACAATDFAKRVAKARAHENLPRVLTSGWTVEVWGWKKVNGRWKVRKVNVRTMEETNEWRA